MRNCLSCGAPFHPQRHYHHQCWTCWRAERNDETRSGAWADGFAAGVRAGRAERRDVGLDDGLLMAAIRLCHPDRHPVERNAEANRVTARLLELRALAEVGR